MASVGLISSCNGENDSTIDQQAATVLITSTNTAVKNFKTGINNEHGFKVMKSLNDLLTTSKFGTTKAITVLPQSINTELSIIRAGKLISDNNDCLEAGHYIKFLLLYSAADNFGTYTFNAQGQITYNAQPNNAIVYVFPYNNGTATITYTDINTATEGNEHILKGIKCTIKVGDTVAGNISYQIPSTTATLSIKLGDYDYNMVSSYAISTSGISISQTTTAKQSGRTIINEITNAKLTGQTNFDIVSKLSFDGIDIKVNILATMAQLENPTTNLNDIYTIEVYTPLGKKIGHIGFEGNTNNAVGYFYFNDGVRIKADVLMPEIYSFLFEHINDMTDF